MNQPSSARPSAQLAWTALAALSLVALLVAFRPYIGIAQDGRIYAGFALAALDPHGVGADVMFAKDGQAGLSLFPPIAIAVAKTVGVSGASRLLTLAGLFVWLAAAAVFLRTLAKGSLLWAALACALVLPPTYGGFDILGYLDPYMTPRSLAEALVLLGLAALIGGRRVLGLAALAVAGLVHPVMTLAGVAVGFVLLVAEDRRWLIAGAAALATIGAGAALHLPMVDRLLIPIDPLWLEILRSRTTYLFPGLWTLSDHGRIAVQLATVAVAAGLVEGRARLALSAIAAIAVGGVLLTLAFGEWAPSLLIAQLQPWRATWLLAVAANASLALAAVGLWRLGGARIIVLAVLAMAWLVIGQGWLAAGFAVWTLILYALAATGRLSAPSPLMRWMIALTVAGLAAIWLAQAIPQLNFLRAGLAAGVPMGWPELLKIPPLRIVAAAAAIVVVMTPLAFLPRPAVWTAAIVAGGAAILALLTWDARTPDRRMVDEGQGATTLRATIGDAPGPVQWIDGTNEAWLLAGRANWASSLQGASIVFSRPLAVDWDARTRALIAMGLAQTGDRSPYLHPADDPVQPAASGVVALCGRADGPVAVVMAAPAPAGLPVRLWSAPATRFIARMDRGQPTWRRITAYAVISCTAVRQGLSGLRP